MIATKIERLRSRNQKLTEELSQPDIFSDQQRYRKLAREQSEISQVVQHYDELQSVIMQIEEDEKIIDLDEDADLVSIAREEIGELNRRKEEMA